MGEAGRPTDLTKELVSKIKQSILDGNNLKETAKTVFDTLEQFKDTTGEERDKELANFTQKIYNWNYDNYLNISDKIEGWRRDRKVLLATNNLEEYLEMNTINKRTGNDGKVDEFNDTGLERIKADMTKFTLETLDKNNYSKKSEVDNNVRVLNMAGLLDEINDNKKDTSKE